MTPLWQECAAQNPDAAAVIREGETWQVGPCGQTYRRVGELNNPRNVSQPVHAEILRKHHEVIIAFMAAAAAASPINQF